MPPITRPEHLFVVRMRHEPGAGPAPGQWRGSVEHVASGQRLYFVALGDLTDFIALHLQAIASVVGTPSLDDDSSHSTELHRGD